MLLYGLTIFIGAFLLFQIQPIIARLILPWFGGAAAVWSACLLFFQVVLLLGYLYAHLLVRWLRPRAQFFVHIAALGAEPAGAARHPQSRLEAIGRGGPGSANRRAARRVRGIAVSAARQYRAAAASLVCAHASRGLPLPPFCGLQPGMFAGASDLPRPGRAAGGDQPSSADLVGLLRGFLPVLRRRAWRSRRISPPPPGADEDATIVEEHPSRVILRVVAGADGVLEHLVAGHHQLRVPEHRLGALPVDSAAEPVSSELHPDV